MFSAAVLDHFKNPRNAGSLPEPSAVVNVSNPVCGDVMEVAVRVEEGRITAARFLCRGCTTAIACGSLLTELLTGSLIADARDITARSLAERLGGIPVASYHGAQLAADALVALFRKL